MDTMTTPAGVGMMAEKWSANEAQVRFKFAKCCRRLHEFAAGKQAVRSGRQFKVCSLAHIRLVSVLDGTR